MNKSLILKTNKKILSKVLLKMNKPKVNKILKKSILAKKEFRKKLY